MTHRLAALAALTLGAVPGLFLLLVAVARTGHEWAIPLLAILAMAPACWIVERHHQGDRR